MKAIRLIATVIFMSVVLVGCAKESTVQKPTVDNKLIASRFWQEGWVTGNQDVFDELCDTTFVNHDPTLPEVDNLQSYKEHVALHTAAFSSDGGVDVEDVIEEGDRVAVRWTWRITHHGEYMGIPPTGDTLVMTGISIHRLADGKIVENWHNYDALGFMQQLGAVPAMGREYFTWGKPDMEVMDTAGNADENKAIYRREADELWIRGDISVVDEIFAADFVNHDPSWPAVVDQESFRQWAAMWTGDAADPEIKIEDLVAEGDKLAARWTFSWTDTAGVAGNPPTGKRITVTGIDIIRCADGKIKERWWGKDVLGVFQQLGIIPPPGEVKDNP